MLWSAREPHRAGELAPCPPGRLAVLGRAPVVGDSEQAICFAPRRPSLSGTVGAEPQREILGEALSRRQLEIVAEQGALLVRNVGRCPMWVDGVLSSRARVVPGSIIHLQQQLLLLCVGRRTPGPMLRNYPVERLGEFGYPDRDGIVGESEAVWRLRGQLATAARSEGHVLILGASGSGKELTAQAVHSLSARGSWPLIGANIAAIPASLGAALLFGNRRNFPNPGMEERGGLIGAAEGGTLFLDEVGDMAAELQPMVLRVMEQGEYLRLGDEGHPRQARVRFIGATNCPERLRLELRRRFQHEVTVPDLTERREDIPLLVRHILTTHASRRADATRFMRNGHPCIDPRLLEQLIRHPYQTNISELSLLLGRAIQASCGEVLMPLPVAPPTTRHPPPPERPSGAAPGPAAPCKLPSRPSRLPSAEEAHQALASAGGSVSRAAALLSITRHQLNRLIQRERLRTAAADGAAGSGRLVRSRS